MDKFWNKIKSDLNKLTHFLVGTSKPLVLKKKDEIDLKSLKKKTKKDLEKLGRKVGVELDRRLTKDKLIKQIRKACK